MAVKLDGVSALDIPPTIANRFVQMPVERLDKKRLPFFGEGVSLREFFEMLHLHLSTAKEVHHRFLCKDPVRLDEVEDERFFVVVVGVQETDVRVESGDDAGLFHQGVKDPIPIVKERIELVGGRIAAPSLEPVLLGEDEAQDVELDLPGLPFESHDRPPPFVQGSGKGRKTLSGFPNLICRFFQLLGLIGTRPA